MGTLLGFAVVLLLAALAWPAWSWPWDGLRELALLGLALLALVGVAGRARGGWARVGRRAMAAALGRLAQRALDVTVNDASMMSACTKVVSASRA